MMRWVKLIAFVVAVILLLLTFVNASWLASAPPGTIRLVARGGVAQQVDATKAAAPDDCTARQIEPPVHQHLENTVRSLNAAWGFAADMVELPLVQTRDGRLAVFGDLRLECRTNATGEVRQKTLAELQKLDLGYGYTADGKTFPLRGLGDKIPSVEEAIAALPITAILFRFTTDGPAAADRLAAALAAAGRDVTKRGDGFTGARAPVERIRAKYPKAWAWTLEDARQCTSDYALYGWLTMVPESCRNGTLLVPLDRQWIYAGWPNRLLARMTAAGARVVVTGPRAGDRLTGLSLPEQLGKIPQSYKGYVLVDDVWNVAPALRPDRDVRTLPQQNAAEKALERRRKR